MRWWGIGSGIGQRLHCDAARRWHSNAGRKLQPHRQPGTSCMESMQCMGRDFERESRDETSIDQTPKRSKRIDMQSMDMPTEKVILNLWIHNVGSVRRLIPKLATGLGWSAHRNGQKLSVGQRQKKIKSWASFAAALSRLCMLRQAGRLKEKSS